MKLYLLMNLIYRLGFELIMQLEEEFGIEIPDEDAENITTVGAAVEYIDSKS